MDHPEKLRLLERFESPTQTRPISARPPTGGTRSSSASHATSHFKALNDGFGHDTSNRIPQENGRNRVETL
jgi:hypothetical protein